ncbi:unnamed protein product [Boreogadus saida]
MTRSLQRRLSIAPQTEENTMFLERRLSTAPLCRNLFGGVDHVQTGENLMTLEKRTATAPLCRNLFGAVDHEQLSRDLNRPAAGGDGRAGPAAVELQLRHGRASGRRVPLGDGAMGPDRIVLPGSVSSRLSNTLRFPSEGTPVRRKRTKASPDNARITDFFVKRRRSSDSRSLKSPLSFPSEALWKGLR